MELEQTPPKSATIINCNGKSYNLIEALPLTFGMLCELEDRGVSVQAFQRWEKGNVSFKEMFSFLFILIKNIDPEIKESDVQAVKWDDTILNALQHTFASEQFAGQAEKKSTT